MFPRTYPKGQSVEIIKTKILEENLIDFDKSDKEHVTTYFYKNSANFKIKNFINNSKKNHIKLSIDTIGDLKKLKKILIKKIFKF